MRFFVQYRFFPDIFSKNIAFCPIFSEAGSVFSRYFLKYCFFRFLYFSCFLVDLGKKNRPGCLSKRQTCVRHIQQRMLTFPHDLIAIFFICEKSKSTENLCFFPTAALTPLDTHFLSDNNSSCNRGTSLCHKDQMSILQVVQNKGTEQLYG